MSRKKCKSLLLTRGTKFRVGFMIEAELVSCRLAFYIKAPNEKVRLIPWWPSSCCHHFSFAYTSHEKVEKKEEEKIAEKIYEKKRELKRKDEENKYKKRGIRNREREVGKNIQRRENQGGRNVLKRQKMEEVEGEKSWKLEENEEEEEEKLFTRKRRMIY